MDDAKIAWKIREKIHEFSGKLSAGLPKTAQRLVREVRCFFREVLLTFADYPSVFTIRVEVRFGLA